MGIQNLGYDAICDACGYWRDTPESVLSHLHNMLYLEGWKAVEGKWLCKHCVGTVKAITEGK